MKPYVLEVCVDSFESAILAQRGGAHRIELCANLILGGTTPGVALLRQIKEHSDQRIHVLIRPRFGDFLYSEHEFTCIQKEVELLCEEGADGIVIGCLKADGSLNMNRMKVLIKLAGGKSVTLHRAFDLCSDPEKTLMQAVELGIDTILTSGQQEDCRMGMPVMKKLSELAGDNIELMPGAGVNAEVIKAYLEEIPAIHCFHMSGKKIIPSGMKYRKEGVSMGLPGFSEYEIFRTDMNSISKARKILDFADADRRNAQRE